MIKQDYLIRMIQEVIALLANVILNQKKLLEKEWSTYDHLTQSILGLSTEDLLHTDADTLIDRYGNDSNRFGKLELAAMYQLRLAEELKDDNLVYRSKLQQEALAMLKYIQEEGDTFSVSRLMVISHLEKNIR